MKENDYSKKNTERSSCFLFYGFGYAKKNRNNFLFFILRFRSRSFLSAFLLLFPESSFVPGGRTRATFWNRLRGTRHLSLSPSLVSVYFASFFFNLRVVSLLSPSVKVVLVKGGGDVLWKAHARQIKRNARAYPQCDSKGRHTLRSEGSRTEDLICIAARSHASGGAYWRFIFSKHTAWFLIAFFASFVLKVGAASWQW